MLSCPSSRSRFWLLYALLCVLVSALPSPTTCTRPPPSTWPTIDQLDTPQARKAAKDKLRENPFVVAIRELFIHDYLLWKVETHIEERELILTQFQQVDTLTRGQVVLQAGSDVHHLFVVEDCALEVVEELVHDNEQPPATGNGTDRTVSERVIAVLRRGAAVGAIESMVGSAVVRSVKVGSERCLLWALRPQVVARYLQDASLARELRKVFVQAVSPHEEEGQGRARQHRAYVNALLSAHASSSTGLSMVDKRTLLQNELMWRIRNLIVQDIYVSETDKVLEDNGLIRNFRCQVYEPGEVVLLRGTEPSLFVVENGTLEVTAENGKKRLALLRHGDGFGALEIIYDLPVLRTVQARTTAHVWKLDSKFIRPFLSDAEFRTDLENAFLENIVSSRIKTPVVLVPGLASTQLIAWKKKACAGSDIKIGDVVWLQLKEVLSDALFRDTCWVDCMSLEPVEDLDPPDCKLRPNEGLSAIYELAPGPLTATVTTIYRSLVRDLSRLNYDVNALLGVPYDWRLGPASLQRRDKFFNGLKLRFEAIVQANNDRPALIVAHSMGNKLFAYFFEWLCAEWPDTCEHWIDTHITTMISLAAPWLGAVETMRSMITGVTQGLPISEAAAAGMLRTFTSLQWLLPIEEAECAWPPSLISATSVNGKTQSFSASEATRGKLFQGLSKILNSNLSSTDLYDATFDKLRESLQRNFYDQPHNPLRRGPRRLPVRNVKVIYGTDLVTEVGYDFSVKHDADGRPSFVLDTIITEEAGGRLRQTTAGGLWSVEAEETGNYNRSGDGSVPYGSLRWPQTWHEGPVTQRRVEGTLSSLNLYNSGVAYTSYDSSHECRKGVTCTTSVTELQGVHHRDIVRAPVVFHLVRETLRQQAKQEFLEQAAHGGDTQDQSEPSHKNEL